MVALYNDNTSKYLTLLFFLDFLHPSLNYYGQELQGPGRVGLTGLGSQGGGGYGNPGLDPC